MKPKLFLLSISFIVFYEFQEITWAINRLLLNQPGFNYLMTKRGAIAEVSTILSWVAATSIGYLIFYHYFYKKGNKILAIFVYIFAGLPLMILSRYLIQEIIVFEIWGFHNYGPASRQPLNYILDNFHFTLYYSAFGLVFFFIQLANYNNRKQNELEVQTRNAELSFLKSQINPHFLFNSLNNVYTLVYQGSANALPAISKLSDLLRYMLYEKEERVLLTKELEYLLNYINLQLLRYDFNPQTKINLHLPAESQISIVPLALIPFVENAFKHGDLKDQENPLEINLDVTAHVLQFLVRNKKGNFHKDSTGGIGMENVKKRLALIYGESHQLLITETESVFTVQLSIDL